jgi:hypothetical protein
LFMSLRAGSPFFQFFLPSTGELHCLCFFFFSSPVNFICAASLLSLYLLRDVWFSFREVSLFANSVEQTGLIRVWGSFTGYGINRGPPV